MTYNIKTVQNKSEIVFFILLREHRANGCSKCSIAEQPFIQRENLRQFLNYLDLPSCKFRLPTKIHNVFQISTSCLDFIWQQIAL